MNDSARATDGQECPPRTKNPAPQPAPPRKPKDCECDLPDTKPPEWKYSEPCKPDPSCHCPSTPTPSGPDCLQTLITEQAGKITEAESAKVFKTDLEAFVAKAKVAAQEYNLAKYDKLLKLWEEQDRDIAELIRKLECSLSCWKCILECYVCPIINDLHSSELQLYYTPVEDEKKDVVWKLWKDYHNDYFSKTKGYVSHNLYDVRYWCERDLDFKQRVLQRIKNVLAAWEKPAQTLDKNLADDAKLIADCSKAIGTDPSTAVYDIFLKLVPTHLAIAPPAPEKNEDVTPKSGTKYKITTRIDRKYTEFCKCDTGDPDTCCGPETGVLTWRRRLIGPQPYLIDPNDYFSLICCLIERRYKPAKDQLAVAEAASQKADDDIKRHKAKIDDALKTFEKTAKGAIPGNINCCDYKQKNEEDSAAT